MFSQLKKALKSPSAYFDFFYFSFVFTITVITGMAAAKGSMNYIQVHITEGDGGVLTANFHSLLSGNFSNTGTYYGLASQTLTIIILYPILILLGLFNTTLSFQDFSAITKIPSLLSIPITTFVLHFILRKHTTRWIAYLAPLIVLGNHELIQLVYSLHCDNPQMAFAGLALFFLCLAYEAVEHNADWRIDSQSITGVGVRQGPVQIRHRTKYGCYIFFTIIFSSLAIGSKLFSVFLFFPVMGVVYLHLKKNSKKYNFLHIAALVTVLTAALTLVVSPNFLFNTSAILEKIQSFQGFTYCTLKENILYFISMKFFLFLFNSLSSFLIPIIYFVCFTIDSVLFIQNKKFSIRWIFHLYIVSFLLFHFFLNRDVFNIFNYERYLLSFIFSMIIPVFHFLYQIQNKFKPSAILTFGILVYTLAFTWFGFGIRYFPQKTIINQAQFTSTKTSCPLALQNELEAIFSTTGKLSHIRILKQEYNHSERAKYILSQCGAASTLSYGKIFPSWHESIQEIITRPYQLRYTFRGWLTKYLKKNSSALADSGLELNYSSCYADDYDLKEVKVFLPLSHQHVSLKDVERLQPTYIITMVEQNIAEILKTFSKYKLIKTFNDLKGLKIFILENTKDTDNTRRL